MTSSHICINFNRLTFQLLPTVSAPSSKMSFYTTIMYIQQNLLLLLSLGYRSSDTGFIPSSHICLDVYQLTFQLLLTVSASATTMLFYATIMYIQQNLLLLLSLGYRSSDTGFILSSHICLDVYQLTF